MKELEVAAQETIDLTVAGIREIEYVEWLQKTYLGTMKDVSNELGAEPRKWGPDDLGRILFEAIAYMSALLLVQEIGSYLTRPRLLLFGREPDRARMDEFEGAFLKRLETKTRSMGIWTAHVLPAAGSPGYEITTSERLAEYTRARDSKQALEHFGVSMGRAMDPSLIVVTSLVALESVPMLVRIIRIVLGQRFGGPSSV